MARHDYDLPPDYEKRVEEGTMSEWYDKERNKRRVMKQDTTHQKQVESALKRLKRKASSRSIVGKLKELVDNSDE